MEKIIEGQNITFSYDGTEVLKGINISISKGKIVGVLGANGAGKSTLLKILCGILNPKIGRILYKSKEIKNVSKRKVAINAMETVGVKHLQDRLITEISGGERQLSSLARAIAQEPEIMILDEPATFLDLKHKTEVMKLLKKLKDKKNISVIAATNDIFSALSYFDEIILLKDGSIFAEGSTEEILKEEILSAVYEINVTVKKENGKIFVLPTE